MPIVPPSLDDRSFHDLVEEVLARVPGHTPEWSNPRVGDPGRTLVELFAWLVDTLLYRANLIPEKQRLQFLRLLGIPMRGAGAARGVVSIELDDDLADPVTLRRFQTVKGPASFETLGEVTVLPITAACFYKRAPDEPELDTLGAVLPALPQVYGLGDRKPCYYVTTPIFVGGAAVPAGLDVVRDTIDGSVWIALLARDKDQVDPARAALGTAPDGSARLLSVGFAPAIELPALSLADAELARRLEIPHVFEATTGRPPTGAATDYLTLERAADSTAGLTRRGVVRLALPSAADLGVPRSDLDDPLRAGVGDRPPRIDDAQIAERVVTWVRLRPTQKLDSFRISWLNVNAVELEQRRTLEGLVIATSSGAADQEVKLPGDSIDAATLVLQVEDPSGWVVWRQIADLALADRDDEVYTLDAEAGVVRFGDGVRGRIPPPGSRVRLALMRWGGGAAGNLPPSTLKALDAPTDVERRAVTRPLVVRQGLATEGGADAETLVEAERRIPSWLRHRDRAVTSGDFRSLAAETPGVALGRVEVLPQFKPQQRRGGVPGVVSVMVWPQKPAWLPPNPRADRPLVEVVHAWLDERRPLATEMYVIGCEYRPVAVSAGIVLRAGSPRDEVLAGVRDAIRRFLWPLVPGGPEGTGWPLGRAVREREIEVVVAQAPGVGEVVGITLFEQRDGRWSAAPGDAGNRAVTLEAFEVPELLSVIATVGDPPADPSRFPNPFDHGCVAIPVVPEVC
jgi:predicted phage baseplate assembly protein